MDPDVGIAGEVPDRAEPTGGRRGAAPAVTSPFGPPKCPSVARLYMNRYLPAKGQHEKPRPGGVPLAGEHGSCHDVPTDVEQFVDICIEPGSNGVAVFCSRASCRQAIKDQAPTTSSAAMGATRLVEEQPAGGPAENEPEGGQVSWPNLRGDQP